MNKIFQHLALFNPMNVTLKSERKIPSASFTGKHFSCLLYSVFSAVWEARSEARGGSNFVSRLEEVVVVVVPPLSEISSNLVFFSSLRFSCWSTYFCWAPGLRSSRNLILTVRLAAGAGVDCPDGLINHYQTSGWQIISTLSLSVPHSQNTINQSAKLGLVLLLWHRIMSLTQKAVLQLVAVNVPDIEMLYFYWQ